MQLKLAQYNAEGKFERFLELGKDFGYFGNSISVYHEINVWHEECQKVYRGRVDGLLAVKDEKDPINRFNGLFDGRTYGDGRFVLIKGLKVTACESFKEIYWEDDIFNPYGDLLIVLKMRQADFCSCWEGDENMIGFNINHVLYEKDYLGNIHQRPELWKNIDS